MKKQLVVALTLTISSFSFAQKKELKEAEKAIKNNNYAEAKAALSEAEGLMSSMDDKLKSKYYYLKAASLYAGGSGSNPDIKTALGDLENVTADYQTEAAELKTQMVQNFLTKGNDAYEKKDYSTSSKYFENAYRASTQDTLYLYYAAATAVSVQEYDRALTLYEELNTLGYEGVETQFVATNKETGEVETFNDQNMRDISVKAGTHIKPSTQKTDSKRPEIIKNIALIYISNGENEKAEAAMEEARKENPDDLNLLMSQANLYFKMGKTDKFKTAIEEAASKDPNNPELQFNLGVVAQESEDLEAAEKYYKKAIELDPTYLNAEINLAALILGRETAIVEEMNGLGNSSADNKRYDELKEARTEVYKSATPYLENVLKQDPDNLEVSRTLMNIYSALGDTSKYQAMKAKVEELSKG